MVYAPLHLLAVQCSQAVTNGLSHICQGDLPTAPADTGALQSVLAIVFGIVGAAALLIIVVSGLRYITSAGDPQKTAKAKNGIIYALVGLIIAITAEAIVAFVVNKL